MKANQYKHRFLRMNSEKNLASETQLMVLSQYQTMFYSGHSDKIELI